MRASAIKWVVACSLQQSYPLAPMLRARGPVQTLSANGVWYRTVLSTAVLASSIGRLGGSSLLQLHIPCHLCNASCASVRGTPKTRAGKPNLDQGWARAAAWAKPLTTCEHEPESLMQNTNHLARQTPSQGPSFRGATCAGMTCQNSESLERITSSTDITWQGNPLPTPMLPGYSHDLPET